MNRRRLLPGMALGVLPAIPLAPGRADASHRLRVMIPTRQFLRENRFEEAINLLAQSATATDHPDDQAVYLRALFYLAHARTLRACNLNGQAATRLTDALRPGDLSAGLRQRVEDKLDSLIEDLWAENR